MGIFGDMGKSEEKTELPKEEKRNKPEVRKQRKGKIDSFILRDGLIEWIILDVDGNGERLKFNPKEHENLKKGDVLIIT